MLIDATINLDYDPDPELGGARFPPTVWPDQGDIERAYARWLELGLARKYNLQQFLRIRLQVREHPNLFKHRKRQVLRLVDDQYAGFTCPESLHEPLI